MPILAAIFSWNTFKLGILLAAWALAIGFVPMPDIAALPIISTIAPAWTALGMNRCIALIASAYLARNFYDAVRSTL